MDRIYDILSIEYFTISNTFLNDEYGFIGFHSSQNALITIAAHKFTITQKLAYSS